MATKKGLKLIGEVNNLRPKPMFFVRYSLVGSLRGLAK